MTLKFFFADTLKNVEERVEQWAPWIVQTAETKNYILNRSTMISWTFKKGVGLLLGCSFFSYWFIVHYWLAELGTYSLEQPKTVYSYSHLSTFMLQ